MKSLYLFFFLFFFGFVMQGQVSQISSQTFKEVVNEEITREQATTLLYNADDMIIIDVRSSEEFNTGHIDNAINVDFKSGDFQSKLEVLDKAKTYIVYCRSGAISAKAKETMFSLGFNHLYLLKGGYVDWQTK